MDLYRISSIDDLKDLLDLLRAHDVGEFEVESDGRRLRVTRGKLAAAMPAMGGLTGYPGLPSAGQAGAPEGAGSAAAPPAAAHGAPGPAALPPGVRVVASPMVGTFYRASSPEADPFVQVGDRIDAEAAVCIIEAMKVMNEIPAGVSGVVSNILVENGDSVEFGQPLFHIQAD